MMHENLISPNRISFHHCNQMMEGMISLIHHLENISNHREEP